MSCTVTRLQNDWRVSVVAVSLEVNLEPNPHAVGCNAPQEAIIIASDWGIDLCGFAHPLTPNM